MARRDEGRMFWKGKEDEMCDFVWLGDGEVNVP